MASTDETRRASLERIFRPQSVAVVGASPSHRWGRQSLENFQTLRFPGKVAAINPKYDNIIGFPCYSSLKGMPFVPDTVLVGVNRERVVGVVEEAAGVGAKGCVVFAIGFAEAGAEGRRMQERITEVCCEAGMALIGPNCQGIINFVHPVALYMDAVQPYEPGRVALFAQSGSVIAALINNKRGVRWSAIVSCGNEAVSGGADLIEYFVDDPHTDVITAFVETIREPERFLRQCERAREAGKPVIILKSGRTDAGRRAATAHSGTLSPPDRLVDELFKRHGVLRVDSMEELLETALAVSSRKRPKGNRVATVTASGGQIELILDETEGYGLVHPPLAHHTQAFLRTLLPDFLATSNPLDYWGIPDFEAAYPKILTALVQDPNIDVVVGIADVGHGPTGHEGREHGPLEAAAQVSATTDKVVAMVSTIDGTASPALVERAATRDVLLLSGIQVGLRAVERLIAYSRPTPSAAPARRINDREVREALEATGGRPTAGLDALRLLAAAGIPTVQSHAVTTEDDTVRTATAMGFPVVLKIGDPGVLHKTETRGVLLNIGGERDAREGFRRLRAGGANVVLVQGHVSGCIEMILGIQTDPLLGTFVLAGLGGVWTEVLNDVAIRPAGLREGDARRMLDELRSRRLLDGLRGEPALDIGALAGAVEQVDALAQQFGPDLESVDINPVFVLPRGVVAVDALVVPRRRGFPRNDSPIEG